MTDRLTDRVFVASLSLSGKPEGLKNCTTVNQTYESLTIVCGIPGGGGGGEQSFILEVNSGNERKKGRKGEGEGLTATG